MSILSDFRLRYPAMASVSDDTCNYWLTDAETVVGDNWPDETAQKARFAYAAHMITVNAVNPDTGAVAVEGVSSFRSGSFSLTMTDAAASRTGFDATAYGREFNGYRHAAFAGPRVY